MNYSRYAFGENWQHFISHLDPGQRAEATSNLARLVGDIRGKTFLDVGSGSGLHSLAALSLGAASVQAVDHDPQSVQATSALLSTFATGQAWAAAQGDILNGTLSESLTGKGFDVVYSWGVLHHTGHMWQALHNACALCNHGGILAIALYLKTPWCGFWKKEKRLYCRHKWLRPMLEGLLMALILLRKGLAGENPWRYVSGYSSSRGMNFFTDIRDWLGGYPYESIDDAELHQFLLDQGFSLVRKFNTQPGRGLLGTGCGEWVYQKQGPGYAQAPCHSRGIC